MFLAIISPILRSTRLCLQLVAQCNIKTDYTINSLKHVSYNNINIHLDATITNFIDNYNQITCFYAINYIIRLYSALNHKL